MKFYLKVSPAVFSSCSGAPRHFYDEEGKTRKQDQNVIRFAPYISPQEVFSLAHFAC